MSVSHRMPSYDYQDYNDDYEEEIEIERRYGWQVTSWILMSLTLILNLAVIFVLLVRQNAYNVVNKGEYKTFKCICIAWKYSGQKI